MRAILLLIALACPAAAQEFVGHGGPVRALAALEGGNLASGGFDQAVILWDPARATARRVLRWHGEAVTALVALPGDGFASAGDDGRVALWPAAPGAEPARVLEAGGVPIGALAVAADGAVAAGLRDGGVLLWHGDAAPVRLEGHAGPVNGLAFTPGGLASAGYDGRLLLWDGPAPRLLAEHGLPLNALVALPGGGLAAGAADGALLLLGADGRTRVLEAGARPLVALAASPDGVLLAAATLGGNVGLWALPEGRLLRTLEGPGLPIWSLAFAADGAVLWSGGQDARLRAWDVATGLPRGPLAPPLAEAALPAGADAAGARVFRACQACHALSAEAPPMAGPHLAGLFGRRMGSVPGYSYSPRLAQGDITWSAETLADLFTRGPDVVTPGTRMPVQRVAEPAELATLLRFLEAATR